MRLGSLSEAKQGLIRGLLPNREVFRHRDSGIMAAHNQRRIRGTLRFFTRRHQPMVLFSRPHWRDDFCTQLAHIFFSDMVSRSNEECSLSLSRSPFTKTCRSFLDRRCCHTALFNGTQECHRTNTALRLARSAAAAALCSVDYPVCQGPGTT